ncbi:peptidoglycan DD-metalloendopeptidase family protein [Arthrobacter sp. IA7]|uniref:peptidoglycan DD-metalloendopeptidase family protein n=1 Tax=Arthrobacter ipis TaxID=2716202 RepID=UPI00168225A6|nr:peptidoglycan DD-metalloendopeptidase family protein [Arthrobacter ipis]MBD1541017.1 peptidoglycan DD-metalloendopeptidase family protein [Arthrobacter ipis]
MPVVGIAEVLVKPIFSGTQRTISKEFGPAADKVGREAGSRMGKGVKSGFAAETAGLEAEVGRLGKAVSQAEDSVAASKAKVATASSAESKALGDLRVAELKLAEVRENSNAKASQIAAAEEKLNVTRSRAAEATTRRETAERNLAKTTTDLGAAHERAGKASADLETHMKRLGDESENTERKTGRLGTMLRNAFGGDSPLAGMVVNMRRDSDRIRLDLSQLATDAAKKGADSGQAFASGFLRITGMLSMLAPAAGAAGASLLSASGNAITFAASLSSLAGVAALLPAGLMAVGAGAGVLVTAFAGVGEALKSAVDAAGAVSTINPRLQAMAVEDAMMAITVAEENAAQAQESAARRVAAAKQSLQDTIRAVKEAEESAAEAQVAAARRVTDAKRSLQDVTENVAEAQERAARAVEMAERREAEAAKDVVAAQKALVEAREKAAARVAEVGTKLRDANLKATDSALALQRATDAYNKAKADPKAGQLQLAQLENNMAKAAAADQQAKSAVMDLRDEQKSAQAEAKAGNDAVRAAEEKLAKARQSEADAIYDRKQAQAEAIKQQKDGARQIADAQQAIADAVQDQKKAHQEAAKVAEDGARRVADAEQSIKDATEEATRAQKDSARAVEQAHRNLERVQMQQADQAEQGGAKSAAAMAALTPAAQESVRALLTVKDMLSGIRKIAQENFFTGFAAPLLGLANTIMPQLATGVGAIASQLGAGARIFMGAVQSSLGNGVLESLLKGVADTTGILNTAITPVVEAFTTLGVVGMDYMPRLAQLVADVAKWFNDIVQKSAADGSLKAWIDGGIQSLKDLWSIGKSVVGIFQSMNDAATAGGAVSTLSGLAAGLRDIDAAMKGPVFQTTMATLFSGAQTGADGLLKALGPIADAFVRGAPAMSRFLELGGQIAGTLIGGVFTALSNPQFGAGLVTFMEGLQRGAEAVAPLLPGLTGAFGDLLTSIAPIVAEIGPSLVELLTGFAGGLAGVISFLQPMLSAIAGSPVILGLLIGGIIAANLVLAGMSSVLGFAQAAMALWAARADIAAAAQWLLNAATSAFPVFLIVAAIAAVVAGLVWFFTQTQLGKDIIANVWAGIQVAINAVVTWFQTVAMPIIQKVFAVVGAVFTWLYQNIIKPVWNGIVTAFSAAWLVIRGIFQLLVSVIRYVIAPAFTWLWKNAIKPAFDGIGAAISWVWLNILKPTFDVWHSIFKNTLGPVFTWLWKTIIKPAFDGIGSAIKWVWDHILKPVFDALHDVIFKTIPDAFKKGVEFIKTHWDKIRAIAKAPVVFVMDKIINEGLIGGFNKIADILPGIDHLPTIHNKELGFARGGILPGQSSWRNGDDQLVPMRRGEGVYVSEVMRDPFERARLYAMNKAAVAGRSMREARAAFGEGFAKGGILNPLRSMVQTQGYNRIHKGVDFAASVGTPVFATEPGRVSWSGPGVQAPGVWGGNEVHIDGASGIQTWFAHLSSMAVKVGQMVRAGQQIANSGNTGFSSGPHLHFGTFNGGWPNDINPYTYLSGAAQPSGKDSGGFDPLGMLTGLGDKIVGQIKGAFPAAGFMIDAVTGFGKKLFGNVVDWVKGKLGFGSATGAPEPAHDPALYDLGGILPPGISQVVNRTGKPEAILNPQQWADVRTLALERSNGAGGRGDINFHGNVGWDPNEVANRIETKRRDTFAAFGI